jgi:hypothetical protein
MKIITYSKIGYNHPSQANWSYGVWKVDLIDTEKEYNMSFTVKETFGGESRFKSRWQNAGIPVIETKGSYTGTGTQKITGIKKLLDIESEEFNKEIVEFIK